MFWKKYFEKELDLRDENFSEIYKWREKFEKEVNQINEKIEAIIECIRSDRKDINALINIYKTMKPQTKRKK